MRKDWLSIADTVVKVPQMAESITEGTLKQWSKRAYCDQCCCCFQSWHDIEVGDYVEQDEEIATIETDKIDVSVNAPEAGTIKEFLVNEEDTVTVGQDLVKLELGGEPSSGDQQDSKEETKQPTSQEQEQSSSPKDEHEQSTPEENQSQPPKQETKPDPPKQESKPESPKQESKAQPPKHESKSEVLKDESKTSQTGNREERRVSIKTLQSFNIC